MERRLESIQIKYWQKYWDEGGIFKNLTSVIITYRNIVDGIPQQTDHIVINKDTDYSVYEENIQKVCKIAFEES